MTFKPLWQIKLKRPTRRGHVFGPAMGEAGVRIEGLIVRKSAV